MNPSGKIAIKKQSEEVRFLLIRHSKSAMLSKIHSVQTAFSHFSHRDSLGPATND